MAKTYTNLTVANATAGNAILASDFSSVFTTLNNHNVPPLVRARRAGSQTIATGALAAVNFDTRDIDTGATESPADALFTATANFITIKTAGVYLITATVSIDATSATGSRAVVLVHQPTFTGSGDSATVATGTRIAGQYATALSGSIQTTLSATTLYSCAASDKIAVIAFQNSGGNMTISPAAEQSTLSAVFVGKVS